MWYGGEFKGMPLPGTCCFVDGFEQLIEIHRLHKVCVESRLDGLLTYFRRPVSAERDQGYGLASLHLADSAGDFEAIHGRESQIEQNDVWFEFGHQLERIGATVRDLDIVSVQLEEQFQTRCRVHVVIDNQPSIFL
jgi:hypothetical protein